MPVHAVVSPPVPDQGTILPKSKDPQTFKIPSVKCPTCLSKGIEEWVICGKICPRCGTACG